MDNMILVRATTTKEYANQLVRLQAEGYESDGLNINIDASGGILYTSVLIKKE